MQGKILALLFGGVLSTTILSASAETDRRPLVGAEIMLDARDKPEDIDRWFKILAEHQMPVARIFVPRDLSRLDLVFRTAEKYRVKIAATLSARPDSPEGERYIAGVVERYKSSPALDSWILRNEPGQAPAADALAVRRYKAWLREKYRSIDVLNNAWRVRYSTFEEIEYDPAWLAGGWTPPARFIDWYTFWRDHLTWQLRWVAEQIRKIDSVHPTHTNPAGLIDNVAIRSQDLPAWRPFLSSLGASVHPSWHFELLRRDQTALGVSYICDLVKGASEPNPFWVTELQGGNNIFSGNRPRYPFRRDIAQWVWTAIGSGADRVIFWLLNNRYEGNEAGEWSLLDFQGRPSERLQAASEVAKTINQNAELFEDARPIESPIAILLSLETMTLQERFRRSGLAGRDRNAHILSALAYYETLQQLGIPARIKHMHDFDWRGKSSKPQLAILPNVAALSSEQAKGIEAFVRNGNSVLLTGLTGLYDPADKFWPLEKYPLEDLLGATLKELRVVDENCEVSLQSPKINLPCHVWVGDIDNQRAEPIGKQDGWVTAVRKGVARSQAIWIPSLIGLGAWQGDNKPLAGLLKEVTRAFTQDLPFKFTGQQPGCLMRVMQSGRSYITVVTNGGTEPKRCRIQHPEGLSPNMLWGESSSVSEDGSEVALGPTGTVVVAWRRSVFRR